MLCWIYFVLCRNLPYSVTQVEALDYEEVQKKLYSSIRRLKEATLTFLHRIVESRHLIPYGMLYIAKVLYGSLMEKFPKVPEKEVLKVHIKYSDIWYDVVSYMCRNSGQNFPTSLWTFYRQWYERKHCTAINSWKFVDEWVTSQ